MRLIAYLDGIHAKLIAFIKIPSFPEPRPLRLVVDSGCTETCLLQDHVVELEINYQTLADAPGASNTAGGIITPKLLPNVKLSIPVKTGFLNRIDSFLVIDYDHMMIMPPSQDHVPLSQNRVVSLLGMDILRLFRKWKWKTLELVMDS